MGLPLRTTAMIFFGGITFLGMFWDSEYGENLWLIGIGLVGFAGSLLIPKDFP